MKRALITATALALGAGGILSPLAVSPIAAQSSAEIASVQTAAFDVPGMYCELCPVTVKKAMERVEGVQSVTINFAARTATVVFDPAKATIEAIAAASANAGYPAEVRS